MSDGERRLLVGYLAHNPIAGDLVPGRAKANRVQVPERIDVKAIRVKLDMTQEEFAGRFGFSVNTLRHWEQGARQPEGPTRATFW